MPQNIIAIIANGEMIQPERVRKIVTDADLIIAADGGALACEASGIRPHYIVGDLDSIPAELRDFFADVPFRHIADQDSTDMEKALEFARGFHPERIKVLCAFGRRSDHALANALIFGRFNNEIPLEIYDDFGKLWMLPPGNHVLPAEKGRTVSLLAMQPLTNLTLQGFRYPLSHQNYSSSFIGVSNVYESDVCEISFDSGQLFIYEVNDHA